MGKRGQKSETSKQAPTRKTEAAVDRRQNNRMLRQCPSGIAQRPPHHAIAVPTATQNRVTKTMAVAPPLGNNWPTSGFKYRTLSQPCFQQRRPSFLRPQYSIAGIPNVFYNSCNTEGTVRMNNHLRHVTNLRISLASRRTHLRQLLRFNLCTENKATNKNGQI